eukprot:7880102-Lingulodinium_polyedra.AAC.1
MAAHIALRRTTCDAVRMVVATDVQYFAEQGELPPWMTDEVLLGLWRGDSMAAPARVGAEQEPEQLHVVD